MLTTLRQDCRARSYAQMMHIGTWPKVPLGGILQVAARHSPTVAAAGGRTPDEPPAHGPHRARGGTPERSEARRALERCRRPRRARRARDHAAQFRDRFWLSLALTVPVVASSAMVADLLGYSLPDFPGASWIAPVLGTVVFFYGGWPFLTGGVSELRARQPGMMLLIAMAITVAYVASLATTLDRRLRPGLLVGAGALVTIMLLGHWQEMRAHRPGPGRPRRAGRAAARRGRTGHRRRA